MCKAKDITGMRFGKLTVVAMKGSLGGRKLWLCKCDCGNTCELGSNRLKEGKSGSGAARSCGCHYDSIKDLKGQRFGKLTVSHMAEREVGKRHMKWVCNCDCGNTKVVNSSSLVEGITVTCGCRKSSIRDLRIAEDLKYLKKSSIAELRCGDVRENGDVFMGVIKRYYANKWNINLRWIKKEKYTDYSIKQSLRKAIYSAFKSQFRKRSRSEYLLCASIKQAQKHLADQFQEGMSWDNHGEWHIDHIIPMAYAKTQEEAEILCHYSNLQPLWGKDNLTKHAKIPDNAKEVLDTLSEKVKEYRREVKR